ncbi:hypothetical protein BHM03_00025248 [Ensete ventricosum]|nr:hypothetical protein BHM03_00025248 [Ensete ventricosum]
MRRDLPSRHHRSRDSCPCSSIVALPSGDRHRSCGRAPPRASLLRATTLRAGSSCGARSRLPLRLGRGWLPLLAGSELRPVTLERLPLRFGYRWVSPLAS